MPELLLPPSVRDERMGRLEQVMVDRFAEIDITVLLIYVVDHATPAALVELAAQFGALDAAWNAADVPTRRLLLKRILERRRLRGTPWAVRDALEAIGLEGFQLRQRPDLYADGALLADGTFAAAPGSPFVYWMALVGSEILPEPERERLRLLVTSWKQKSVHLDEPWIFYVPTEADLMLLPAYENEHTVPVLLSSVLAEDGMSVHLAFSRSLDGDSIPAISIDAPGVSVVGVALDGYTVTATLDVELEDLDGVRMQYFGGAFALVSQLEAPPDDAGIFPGGTGFLTIGGGAFVVTDDDGFLELS